MMPRSAHIPTTTGRRWVAFVVGFGVSVAIGLAPYLGKLDVPGFTPLLALIPFDLQDSLLPLSSALMGLVALLVEWYGMRRNTEKWLHRNFLAAFIFGLVAFVSLAVIHRLVVITVPIDQAKSRVSVLVGWDDRPTREPCGAKVSDTECVQRLSIDPAQVESFWGTRSVRKAQLALTFAYLIFTAIFGWVVGLIVLARSPASAERRRRA
jgi:hypothetical protein